MNRKLDLTVTFNPPPECDRPGCCDLSCVWEPATLVWEGED